MPQLKGRWSIWVNGNWRLTFEFRDGHASTLSRVLKGSSAVSPEMALRLSKALGRTPESWLAMQYQYDLWRARQHVDLGRVGKVRLTAD
jgi:plasmid maintenance system antidote protein VapI